MEFAGAAFSIAPLVSTCQKIVDILRNVAQKFKRAPLMMTSIQAECNLIIDALEHLRNFDWSTLEQSEDDRVEQMTRCAETIILGCTLSLSVIEEYAAELQDYVEGTKLSPTEQMGIMARVRVLWREDEMRELLLQLRGYQTALTNLLRAAHDDDDEDIITTVLQSLQSLLHRSRTSRSRKPISVRSAMQHSAAYTNLGRGSTSNQQRLLAKASMATATASSSRNGQPEHGVSAATADHYDRATAATAGRDQVIDRSRKKRPGYLGKDRELLRRSSPTVGENFHYVEGQDPEERNNSANGASTVVTLPDRAEEEDDDEESDEDEDENDDDDDEDEEEDSEEEMEEHLEDPPIPPPAMPERLDPITEESSPKPKKQKSTSSVRSQIINLPETARLRKQASGEIARQQAHTLASPTTPSFTQLKSAQGTQSTAHDLLAKRRASELTHRHQNSDSAALGLRFRAQNSGRTSSQDIRPQIIPLPFSQDRNLALGFVTSPSHNGPMSPSLMSPSYSGPPPDEAWPLTPDMPTSPMGFPNNSSHARSMSHDPQTQRRPMSPDDPTPRASRANTPLFSNTPHRGRSRSNTAATTVDESGYPNIDDAVSIAGSIAPSIMSAQWYRTPRERLGLGSRIKTEHVPWEQLDHADEPEEYPNQAAHRHTVSQQSLRGGSNPTRSRKVQLFTIYPPKLPPSNAPPEPPEPRSPLLNDHFLRDVGGLIEHSNPSTVTISAQPQLQPQRPQGESQANVTRSLSFKGLTKRRDRSRETKDAEKNDGPRERDRSVGKAAAGAAGAGKKKESMFSMLKELGSEYNSLAKKWHTSQEDDVDEDDRRYRHPYQNQHHVLQNSHQQFGHLQHPPRPMTSHASFVGATNMSNMSLHVQPTARSQSTQPSSNNMMAPMSPKGSSNLAKSVASSERGSETPSRMNGSVAPGGKSAIPVPASLGKMGRPSAGTLPKGKSSSGSKGDKKKNKSLFNQLQKEYRNFQPNW